MSRRFDAKQRILKAAEDYLSQPMFTLKFLDSILRPKPKMIPKFMWILLLKIILKPKDHLEKQTK